MTVEDQSSDIVVDVQEMSKSYEMQHGSVTALKNVNLKVRRGDSLAIMGPSGSGKSTLLHLLGCLDKPSTGKYLLNRQNISDFDDKALSLVRATQIGFVFQSFNLIPQLNVVENVEIPFIYSSGKKSCRESIIKALTRVGLGHRLDHLPNQLSGGEMQRVAIARALAINPFLILADEPTGNLDFETSEKVVNLIFDLNREAGTTLVLVTHDLELAAKTQRIIRIKGGKLVADDKTNINTY